MNITLDLQIAYDHNTTPDASDFQLWVNTALGQYNKAFELTVRIVDKAESQQLNHQYRHKNSPTNVLSFPFEVPDGVELDLLGDLVICADIVEDEALAQKKSVESHWAHMVLHGCLHLLGYDHIDDIEAEEMENIEINLMKTLGYSNPYIEI